MKKNIAGAAAAMLMLTAALVAAESPVVFPGATGSFGE
jgi:hypothetical protein